MKLSIIVPVYNEKGTVNRLLKQVEAVRLPGVRKEFVVVDDGSGDGTVTILKNLAKKKPSWKFVFRRQNSGKGAAVRAGLRKATGDYVIIQDADLEYDPRDIANLLRPIQEDKARVVYGSRFTGERRNMFFWHMVGNKILSLVTNLLYNTTLSDMEVCYKLFERDLVNPEKLKENRWGFDPEITTHILKQGVRIYEVPISYAGREVEEGKKISWRDGFRILWVLLRERFSG